MPVLAEVIADLGGGVDPVGHRYEAAGIGVVAADEEIGAVSDRLTAAVGAARETDMERRSTTVGPHRDEIVITIGGRDVRTRASQGEQRSVALGLRVASYELLGRRGEPPVLLLDDVFSELDPTRSRRLVERLPGGQVFVTSARDEEVPVAGRRWRVAGGRIEVLG
jgi:DNA replication and repair protein RecF